VSDVAPDPDRIATHQDFGRELTAVRTRAGLLLTLADGAWTAQQAPLPANVQLAFGQFSQGTVAGVSCPSAAACIAVGNYVATSGSGGLLLTQG
jgi:hypothetical protein